MNLRRFNPAIGAALLLAVAAGGVAIRCNTWSVGGADTSGYASQAELWLAGRLIVPTPLATQAPWPEAAWTFAPLGYRPATTAAAIVPTYPAGLPLTLAAVQLLSGRTGIHLVVPVLAGLTVWLAFVLGRRLGGRTAGLVAAIGLATSPIFLRQATQLMSDVPAAAWWTAALVLAYRGTTRAALGSGLVCTLAVLTRPNLAPAALVVFALVLERSRRSSSDGAGLDSSGARGTPWRATASWLCGFVPGCVAVAGIHTVLYGSPLRSGYGSNDELYALSNIAPNLHRYASWLAGSESPLLLLAFASAFVARRRGMSSKLEPDGPSAAIGQPLWPLVAFVAVVVAAYLPYSPFDDWSYTRFLLPALPAAFVLAAVALTSLAAQLGGRWRGPIVVVTTAIAAGASLSSALSLGSLSLASDERRYPAVAAALPRAAASRGILISAQHSGSLRYYTGRPALRWDFLPPASLDTALAFVREHGYQPYLVLDSTEDAMFRARFAGSSDIGRLDWPPSVDLRTPTRVRVYDPAQRAAFMAGGRIETRVIFPPAR